MRKTSLRNLALIFAAFAITAVPVAASAGSRLDLSISGNNISGNGGSGISIVNDGGTFNGAIKGNDITGNSTGVGMTSTGGSFTMDMGTTGASGTNPGNNNITGNGTSVNNNTGTNVPARGNYWGGAPNVVNVGGSTTDTSRRRLRPR